MYNRYNRLIVVQGSGLPELQHLFSGLVQQVDLAGQINVFRNVDQQRQGSKVAGNDDQLLIAQGSNLAFQLAVVFAGCVPESVDRSGSREKACDGCLLE